MENELRFAPRRSPLLAFDSMLSRASQAIERALLRVLFVTLLSPVLVSGLEMGQALTGTSQHGTTNQFSESSTRASFRDQAFIEDLERRLFQYFWEQATSPTGLAPARAHSDASPPAAHPPTLASTA